MGIYDDRLNKLVKQHCELVSKKNLPLESGNGIYERYENPVLTREHIPLTWRYDFNPRTNQYLMERLGVNAAFNAGAIEWHGKICLISRIEGIDRKSFFAIAESENGVDNFKFRSHPLQIQPLSDNETNYYDMRLTAHEDGWIYGLFCVEKHDDSQPNDPSAAVASCGIVRTRDLENWERLPDLKAQYQQRNVVLHPKLLKKSSTMQTENKYKIL